VPSIINGGEQFFLWIAKAAVGDLSVNLSHLSKSLGRAARNYPERFSQPNSPNIRPIMLLQLDRYSIFTSFFLVSHSVQGTLHLWDEHAFVFCGEIRALYCFEETKRVSDFCHSIVFVLFSLVR
jgi:hypothetical protein